MYTLDTNIIIYYVSGEIEVQNFMDGLLRKEQALYISTVTEIELFSFSALTNTEATKIQKLLEGVLILPLDSRIARLAAEIRRAVKIRTPDSAIAATALATRTTLLTRNHTDFAKVPGLLLHKL